MSEATEMVWALRDGRAMQWRGPIEPALVQSVRERGFEVEQVPVDQVLMIQIQEHLSWADAAERDEALKLLDRALDLLGRIGKQTSQLRRECLPLVVDLERFIRECEGSHPA